MTTIKALLKSKRVVTAALGLVAAVAIHLGMAEGEADKLVQLIEFGVGAIVAAFTLRDPGQTLLGRAQDPEMLE